MKRAKRDRQRQQRRNDIIRELALEGKSLKEIADTVWGRELTLKKELENILTTKERRQALKARTTRNQLIIEEQGNDDTPYEADEIGIHTNSLNCKRDNEIARRCQEGETIRSVAKAYDISPQRVQQIVQNQSNASISEIRRQDRAKLADAISELADQDVPLEDIADALGIKPTRVISVMSATKRPIPKRRHRMELDRRDAAILAFIDEGHTEREAALRYGVTQTNVSRIVAKAYNPKQRREMMKKRWNDVERMLNEGLTQKEIAESQNISISMVNVIARKRGIRRNPTIEDMDKVKQQIRDMLAEGRDLSEISKATKTEKTFVQMIAKTLAIPDYAEIAEEIRVRTPIEGIRRKHEVSTKQIYQIAAMEDLPRPKNRHRTEVEKRNAAVMAYVAEGHTQQQTAQKFGISQAYVSHIVNRQTRGR